MAESTDDFLGKVTNCLSMAGVGNGIAVGWKLGLFEHLAKFDDPKSCKEIADALGFKERYVREWLSLMVTGGVIDANEEYTQFTLPKHRREVLTGFSDKKLATLSWYIPMFTKVTNEIVECFPLDGPSGITYDKYPDFHSHRDQLMIDSFTWPKLEQILQATPGIIEKLESGIDICELGCSTGRFSVILAEKFPKSKFLATDLIESSMDIGKKLAAEKGLKNISFQVADMCSMPEEWSNKWDFIFVGDVYHDLAVPLKAMHETARVLKPGGMLSSVDIFSRSHVPDNHDVPQAGFVYFLSLFHCMPISLNKPNGQGLGTGWGIEQCTKLFKETGLDVKVQHAGYHMHITATKPTK